jgi:hypothetical protein
LAWVQQLKIVARKKRALDMGGGNGKELPGGRGPLDATIDKKLQIEGPWRGCGNGKKLPGWPLAWVWR